MGLAVIGPWHPLSGQMAWTYEPPAPHESQGSGQRPGALFPQRCVAWLIRRYFCVTVRLGSGRGRGLGIEVGPAGWRTWGLAPTPYLITWFPVLQDEALAPYSVSREVSHSVLKCETVSAPLMQHQKFLAGTGSPALGLCSP